MILIEVILLCCMILATLAGVTRFREFERLDRLTSILSRWLTSAVAFGLMLYLAIFSQAAWLLPLAFLVYLKVDSHRCHRYFDEFLLLPFVTAEVYILSFFPELQVALSEPLPLLLSLALQTLGLTYILKNLHDGVHKHSGPYLKDQ